MVCCRACSAVQIEYIFIVKKGKIVCMKLSGLTSQQVEESRRKYGANTLTEIPPDPLWKKILEGFKDPMLMILMVALVVQVALFFLGGQRSER